MKHYITLLTLLITVTTLKSQENFFYINLIDESSMTYNFKDVEQINFVEDIISVQDFVIDSDPLTIKVGENAQILYSIFPDNANNQNVNWTSSNENVATIDGSGLVEGISAGQVIITGSTEDGEYTDEITITIEETTSIDFNSSNIKLYPNPTQDLVFIEIEYSNFEVIISDSNGELLFSDYNNKEIDLKNYSSGMYFVTLIINNKYYNYQIIKN